MRALKMRMFPLVSTSILFLTGLCELYSWRNETKFYKWKSAANISHIWTGEWSEDYCSWFILKNVTLNINALKSQCFFFLFNLPTVTARSHIVCPNADLSQKRDPYTVDLRSSKLFLAAYLLDALDFNANICKWWLNELQDTNGLI